MNRFAGRSVFVLGGAGGIGTAVCERIAAEGGHVVVADRDGEGAARVADAVGGRALACDATEPGSVEAAVAATGTIDVLVTSTLSVTSDDLVKVADAAWQTDLDGTLSSVFRAVRAVLPQMLERRAGAIVAISSVNGQTYVGNEAYSAAKAGVDSLVRSVATRYGPRGVRMNGVAPGTVRTAAWNARLAREPDLFERLVRHYPLGRVGDPADVAAAVAFLASDDAAFVSGIVLRVDGGLLAGLGEMANELLVESRGPAL